ncbi:MAG TPA: hypothetical protein VKZ53_22300 [Candidatus Angelobacter sp.]|nr:hypothetical protein [Candidatus Angelobacter sp.]
MSSIQREAQMKRWRGVVLSLVRNGHIKQESRLDDLSLWGLMQDLGYPVSKNDVLTLLQDLCELGYLKFAQHKDDVTGEVSISEIQITALGLRIVARIATDPLVQVV